MARGTCGANSLVRRHERKTLAIVLPQDLKSEMIDCMCRRIRSGDYLPFSGLLCSKFEPFGLLRHLQTGLGSLGAPPILGRRGHNVLAPAALCGDLSRPNQATRISHNCPWPPASGYKGKRFESTERCQRDCCTWYLKALQQNRAHSPISE